MSRCLASILDGMRDIPQAVARIEKKELREKQQDILNKTELCLQSIWEDLQLPKDPRICIAGGLVAVIFNYYNKNIDGIKNNDRTAISPEHYINSLDSDVDLWLDAKTPEEFAEIKYLIDKTLGKHLARDLIMEYNIEDIVDGTYDFTTSELEEVIHDQKDYLIAKISDYIDIADSDEKEFCNKLYDALINQDSKMIKITDREGKSKHSYIYKNAYATTEQLKHVRNIQVIHSFTGSGPEIIKTFDFKHVSAYFNPFEGLVISDEGVDCIYHTKLELNEGKTACPKRESKWSKRGYKYHSN